MTPFSRSESFVSWLLNHSAQAGLLVLLVIAIQAIMGSSLRPGWRFAMWWIVLLKLLIPISPSFSLSIFTAVPFHVSIGSPPHGQAESIDTEASESEAWREPPRRGCVGPWIRWRL